VDGIPYRRIAPPARRAWRGTRSSPAPPSSPPPPIQFRLPLSYPQLPSSPLHLPKTEGATPLPFSSFGTGWLSSRRWCPHHICGAFSLAAAAEIIFWSNLNALIAIFSVDLVLTDGDFPLAWEAPVHKPYSTNFLFSGFTLMKLGKRSYSAHTFSKLFNSERV
jgi:hypothetical protein